MPVFKYRRIEDMPEPWEVFGNSKRAGRLRTVLGFARLAPPLGMPRGVTKYRSFEDMANDRERYDRARLEAPRDRKQ